jgi:hypothetical protein
MTQTLSLLALAEPPQHRHDKIQKEHVPRDGRAGPDDYYGKWQAVVNRCFETLDSR